MKTSSTTDHEHAITGEKLSLLAVFAHPEDEAFGPAGTLAKYASEGVRVALVTASREIGGVPALATASLMDRRAGPREQLCSCHTSGIHRICLLDRVTGGITTLQESLLEERLVRLIRELQPQVVITYGPDGFSGDPEHMLINRLTTRAFHAAGDAACYPEHLRDGPSVHQPLKLYYNILPQSVLQRWGIHGLAGVPDEQVTTVLDVSRYAEAKLKTLYCQRNHILDYARWLTQDQRVQWDAEYFELAASNLHRKTRREKDLFTGLR